MQNPNKLSFIKPEKSPIFYGYIVAIFATIGILASLPGQTVGVSTFTDPVKDALKLSRNQFSNAYMLGTVLSSLFLSRAGVWYDKHGARWVAFFAALILGFTLILSSQSAIISDNLQNFLGIQHWLVPFFVMILIFFLLRYSGQGVLTMVSRNMIMKWFDTKRGRVNAFSAIAVSLGFSASPMWISFLIDKYDWSTTWLILGGASFIFSFIVILFYRDKPEDHGLTTDGIIEKKVENTPSTKIQFTAEQAIKTRAYWMYTLTLSFYSFFVTGLTFHIVSVFETSGYTKVDAIGFFLPMSIISVSISALANYLSDFLKLKLYLYIMLTGGFIAALGLVFMQHQWGVYSLIFGTGILGGMFGVLIAITFPRFYGRKYLGSITGKTMSLLVFASALAPSLFSLSNTLFKNYTAIGYIGFIFLSFIAIASIKANNPQ